MHRTVTSVPIRFNSNTCIVTPLGWTQRYPLLASVTGGLTVPHPIHQILDPTSTAAGVEETPDSKHRASIDELRGRRGRNGRSQRAFLDWFDPGYMEGWLDPHGTRKLKAYHLWVYDAGYGKWSYELGGQLATLHFKEQVTGGEPDLLAKFCRGNFSIRYCV